MNCIKVSGFERLQLCAPALISALRRATMPCKDFPISGPTTGGVGFPMQALQPDCLCSTHSVQALCTCCSGLKTTYMFGSPGRMQSHKQAPHTLSPTTWASPDVPLLPLLALRKPGCTQCNGKALSIPCKGPSVIGMPQREAVPYGGAL